MIFSPWYQILTWTLFSLWVYLYTNRGFLGYCFLRMIICILFIFTLMSLQLFFELLDGQTLVTTSNSLFLHYLTILNLKCIMIFYVNNLPRLNSLFPHTETETDRPSIIITSNEDFANIILNQAALINASVEISVQVMLAKILKIKYDNKKNRYNIRFSKTRHNQKQCWTSSYALKCITC